MIAKRYLLATRPRSENFHYRYGNQHFFVCREGLSDIYPDIHSTCRRIFMEVLLDLPPYVESLPGDWKIGDLSEVCHDLYIDVEAKRLQIHANAKSILRSMGIGCKGLRIGFRFFVNENQCTDLDALEGIHL